MSGAQIEARGIAKTYGGSGRGEGVQALGATDVVARDGEFVSIVGPSGCGKSTLFAILSGLVEPTDGAVLIDGAPRDDLLGSVGLMPQRDLLLPWKTVLDNTALGLTIAGTPKKRARQEALSHFDEFGLRGFEDRWPAELSGGMKQRAALLRTFLTGHDVILLDEPFGALDALTRRSMQQWLLDVWATRRTTILFITHDVGEAVLLSDRVYVMSGRPGTVVLETSIDIPREQRTVAAAGAELTRYEAMLLEPLERPSRSVAAVDA